MNELALYAGAGGGLLATKWLLGWRTVCYVENNEYRIKVLKARIRDSLLDDAPIWDDATTFDGRPWRGCVDIVTAGFPCQPFSVAGKQEAQDDERNLWPDTIRIIREVRPQWCFLENVAGLLSGSHGYFGQILRDLAESGYDARWKVLSAAEVGAPHKRDRLWIVGHSSEIRRIRDKTERGKPLKKDGKRGMYKFIGASCGPELVKGKNDVVGEKSRGIFNGNPKMADPNQTRLEKRKSQRSNSSEKQPTFVRTSWWETEPAVGRVVDGMASRVERLKALGNGQVPVVVKVVWDLLTFTGENDG